MMGLVGQLPVGSEEWLARFIVRKEHVRADGTVKPDPFVPYKWVELSVTRHLGLNDGEIWEAGDLVARQTSNTLQGRADAQAIAFMKQRLRVQPEPTDDNPNHANVVGWPQDKQAQKVIALELIKDVRFTARPASRA